MVLSNGQRNSKPWRAQLTLIVAVEAAECFIMAADILTTTNGRVISSDTQKLHQVSTTGIAAGAGVSRMQGRHWSDIISGFLPQWGGPHPAQTAHQLKQFFDAEIARVDPRNIGACAGENTFLVAGPDPAGGRMDVWSIERKEDRRQFQPASLAHPNAPPARIWWLGDTQSLQGHIAATAAAYSAGMSEQQAVAFAVQAIIDGTSIARSANVATIGGDYVYSAVATQDGVIFSRHPSRVLCP